MLGVHHPYLGIEFTNLYAVDLATSEIIIQQFPHISNGVMVEKVAAESPAAHAGLLPSDVNIEFRGNVIRSSPELFGMVWDKTGESLEILVMRAYLGLCLTLIFVVHEVEQDYYNS
ncbi:Trypsin family protein with PDZ domain, putative [Theobroma cacao]|uniref:Trypsin family protein with PDZ domain, putative n=1 Tax=Theobroma cacao TaxID=3641 RepID=A0A061F2N1_THECC|nr:Trypsin family protein with PDZ domain, putative [Theobroma cacao]